jgi:hypothetical protein
MAHDYSEAIAEAFVLAPAHVIVLDTVEFDHPAIGHLYFVADMVDHIFKVRTPVNDTIRVTFRASNLKIAIPMSGEDGISDISFTMDNTDRFFSSLSETLNSPANRDTPCKIHYRPYLQDSEDMQISKAISLTLASASLSLEKASFRAAFLDVVNRSFLTQNYTRLRFPGLGDFHK